MNVQELREALADLPAHWPVHVAVRADGSGGGADTDYLYTLDVQRDNFPTQGCMAVIRIDYGGHTTDEEAAAFRRGTAGVAAVHPMRDGYAGSVMDSGPESGHKLAVFYATREQADAAQAWLTAGVPGCPESGKHCRPVGGECQTCGAVGVAAGAPGDTDAERAAWLADKIVAGGDYAKEAAAMLRRWPTGVREGS